MRQRTLAFAATAALAASLAAGCSLPGPSGNSGYPDDWDDSAWTEEELGGDFADDNCVHVVAAVSSEKVNLFQELATAFRESPEAKALADCVTVKPADVTSGDAARYLSAGGDWPTTDDPEMWPTLWSPASTVWTERVASAASPGLVPEAASFTHTPVVFAMPESMAAAIGWPGKPLSLSDVNAVCADPEGWGSVDPSKAIWGGFRIAKTNPNTSTTGLSVLLTQAYAAAGKTSGLTPDDVAAAKDFSQAFESCVIHYGDTTGKVLQRLYDEAEGGSGGSTYVSAVALEETSLLNYNQGNPTSRVVEPGDTLTPPKEKLVAVYPSDGSLWSDNPIVVLGAPWVGEEQRAAGQAFAEFVQTKPAQEILPRYGFRPLDQSVPLGQLFTAEYGVDPDQPKVSLEQPDVNTVSVALDQWSQIRKPSSVLELIDNSGSMEDNRGDGRSKMDGAIDGATSTLGHFRPTDEVGLWVFTTELSSDAGDNVAVMREVSPLAGDKETMAGSLADLANARKGGTPLYDAISLAYDATAARAQPGRINAIVVLSDGQDTDSITSLDSLVAKINQANTEGINDAPVRIFPIAYGTDAELDVLERIANASGGQVFDASNPERIDLIFASVINNF
ncbi:MAG: substrate-binding and VWA domain-containing protein [Bifidobacteriaceae bacterium]|jgi:Ca-activated chloride channel family protein|nr:substrate-binding and VWA domain-containing protein [Bifidobacteriaceae bacterium]